MDFPLRKIGSHLSPVKIIIQDGDNFMIKTQSTFITYEFSFTIGVETEEFTKGIDNRILKVHFFVNVFYPAVTPVMSCRTLSPSVCSQVNLQ